MATLDVTRGDRSAYHHVWIILALLIPATLLAFAPTYFNGLTFSQRPVTTLVHLHTALMVLWVLLLISQAWLIRAKQYRIHRWTGRSSFVIVPLIVLVTLMLDRESLNRKQEVTTLDTRLEIFFWGQVIPFVMAWALALMYRRRTPIHMRYMVSTVFAAGTAIVVRIIINWFAWLPGMDLAENLDNINNIAAANGAVLLLMLLGLIANDWRLGIGQSPFWFVAITTLIVHIGFFTFTKTDWWMSFVLWYAGVPS
jgi:hypothetical protein